MKNQAEILEALRAINPAAYEAAVRALTAEANAVTRERVAEFGDGSGNFAFPERELQLLENRLWVAAVRVRPYDGDSDFVAMVDITFAMSGELGFRVPGFRLVRSKLDRREFVIAEPSTWMREVKKAYKNFEFVGDSKTVAYVMRQLKAIAVACYQAIGEKPATSYTQVDIDLPF